MNRADPLAGARSAFARAAGTQVGTLERCLAALDTGTDAAAALRAIGATAHRIAGTAATLGFAEIGAVSRRLDDLLSDATEADAPRLQRETADDVAFLVQALRGVAA